VEFVAAMTDEDDCFAVLLYNLTNYPNPGNLSLPINNPELVPDNINKWSKYFPQAKPEARGGDFYTLVLIGFGKPFP